MRLPCRRSLPALRKRKEARRYDRRRLGGQWHTRQEVLTAAGWGAGGHGCVAKYVFLPPIFGPCRASPVHNSLPRVASNRPKTLVSLLPPAVSPAATKCRCSVRSVGDHPCVVRRIRWICAAVRPGFSRFSTPGGVRGTALRGSGTS